MPPLSHISFTFALFCSSLDLLDIPILTHVCNYFHPASHNLGVLPTLLIDALNSQNSAPRAVMSRPSSFLQLKSHASEPSRSPRMAPPKKYSADPQPSRNDTQFQWATVTGMSIPFFRVNLCNSTVYYSLWLLLTPYSYKNCSKFLWSVSYLRLWMMVCLVFGGISRFAVYDARSSSPSDVASFFR